MTRDQGLGSWPRRRALIAPDDVAVVHQDRSWTYGQLAERVDKLASGLAGRGIAVGDRVAYLGPNHPTFAETLFAVCALGATFVPLNTRLAGPEIAAIVADANPALVVVHATLIDRLPSDEGGPATVVVAGDPAADHGYERLLDATNLESWQPMDVTLDDVAMLMYTSGTTGRAKGVVLTHGNLTWNCFNVLIDVDVSAEDVTLINAPMFHTAALNQTFLPTFLKGGTCVLVEAFDPDETLELIERHGVTWMFGVPAMFAALLHAPGWDHADLSTVRAVEAGGAPVPESLIRAYHARDVVFLQGYGMTEASPGVLFLRARDSTRKVGSAGTPCFFTDVRVVTPRGDDAEVGEPGEVWVRGPNVMSGYWQLPDETRAVLGEEGWFRSGDVAVSDADGFLTIVDRVKDMFISGGENVYPAEVEKALHEHNAIADAAVVGIPDDRWGEVGRAVVVLRPGASLSVDELQDFLDGRLARYKIPKQLEIRDELPRSASGKLLKQDLS